MSVAPLSLYELANVARVCMRGESYGIDTQKMVCACLAKISRENRKAFSAAYKHSPSILATYPAERITTESIYAKAKRLPREDVVNALSTAGLMRYNTDPSPRGRGAMVEACCIVLEMLCMAVGSSLDSRTNPPRRRRSALRRRRSHARR